MKGLGVALIIWGIIGCFFGSMMFGDIGIACIFGSVSAILSGCGFISANKQIKRLWSKKELPPDRQSSGNESKEQVFDN